MLYFVLFCCYAPFHFVNFEWSRTTNARTMQTVINTFSKSKEKNQVCKKSTHAIYFFPFFAKDAPHFFVIAISNFTLPFFYARHCFNKIVIIFTFYWLNRIKLILNLMLWDTNHGNPYNIMYVYVFVYRSLPSILRMWLLNEVNVFSQTLYCHVEMSIQ